jgi:hypothetical protein
LDLIVDI